MRDRLGDRLARRVCAVIAVVSLVGTGCSSSSDTTPQLTGELELFSWWTHVGEKDGLAALEANYAATNPQVQIVTGTVTANGTIHPSDSTDLSARMSANKPPDSFQQLGGPPGFDQWVATNSTDISTSVLEPLDEIYSSQGFDAYYPWVTKQLLSYGGHPWLVPVNVHRTNVLYYNIAFFKQYGLMPPATLADFYTVADALKSKLPAGKDVMQFTTKSPYTIGVMFVDTLLAGSGGGAYYTKFISGQATADDPEVLQAFVDTAHILSYADPKQTPPPSAVDEYDASTSVASGASAMYMVPDWVVANIKAQTSPTTGKNYTVDVDFGEVPAPGTSTYFEVVVDSFVLPKGAIHRDNAIAWLDLVGSKEGQNLFNPKKGTIPPQPITDAEAKQFGYDAFEIQKLHDFAAADKANNLLANGRFCWFPQSFTTPWDNLMLAFFNDQTAACQADATQCVPTVAKPTKAITDAISALRAAYQLLKAQ